jgi:hypothetical protein
VTTGGDTYVLVASGNEMGMWSTDGSAVNITSDVSDVTVEVGREIETGTGSLSRDGAHLRLRLSRPRVTTAARQMQ